MSRWGRRWNGGRMVVAVEDPRWFRLVRGLLERRGASYAIYEGLGSIGLKDIVYTDMDELCGLVYAVCDKEHSRFLFEKAFLASIGRSVYRSVTAAVDPGSLYTLVVLADEYLVHVSKSSSRQRIIEDIVEHRAFLPHKRFVVKIGDGASGRVLAASLSRLIDNVYVVDETGSTRRGARGSPYIAKWLRGAGRLGRDRDVLAAIAIAVRRRRWAGT